MTQADGPHLISHLSFLIFHLSMRILEVEQKSSGVLYSDGQMRNVRCEV